MPSSPRPPTATASPWKSRIGYSAARPRKSVMTSTARHRQKSAEVAMRRQAGQSESITSWSERSRGAGSRSALIDLRDLGVAHVALDGVLADVAVAAQHLHRLDGDGHRGVGGEELRHRGVLAAVGLVAVDLRARLVEQLARGGRPRLHVGELELDG